MLLKNNPSLKPWPHSSFFIKLSKPTDKSLCRWNRLLSDSYILRLSWRRKRRRKQQQPPREELHKTKTMRRPIRRFKIKFNVLRASLGPSQTCPWAPARQPSSRRSTLRRGRTKNLRCLFATSIPTTYGSLNRLTWIEEGVFTCSGTSKPSTNWLSNTASARRNCIGKKSSPKKVLRSTRWLMRWKGKTKCR